MLGVKYLPAQVRRIAVLEIFIQSIEICDDRPSQSSTLCWTLTIITELLPQQL